MADVGSCVSFREVQGEGWSPFRTFALGFAALCWVSIVLQVRLWASDGRGLALHVTINVIIAVVFTLVTLFGRFVTTVHAGHVDLRRSAVGVGFRRRRIPLAAIRSAELGTCYPKIDDGSWAKEARGPGGVRLHLDGGEIVQIASRRPEELLAALRTPEAPPAA
jgi:hypothetical protein